MNKSKKEKQNKIEGWEQLRMLTIMEAALLEAWATAKERRALTPQA